MGMDKESLLELKRKLQSKILPESLHIGLCNVNMRISLIYGELGEMDIQSQQNAGTTVTVTNDGQTKTVSVSMTGRVKIN